MEYDKYVVYVLMGEVYWPEGRWLKVKCEVCQAGVGLVGLCYFPIGTLLVLS